MEDLRAKWDRRYRDHLLESTAPAEVLAQNLHLLPPSGQALDLACGLGANASLLAECGFDVTALDISAVAIRKLAATAKKRGLAVRTSVADVLTTRFEEGLYDVIIVSRFLERSLAPALVAALAPEGLLYYQTFTRERVTASGPSDPDFRLEPNELLHLFPSLRLVFYREEGCIGDVSCGFRDQAMLIGQKPALKKLF